MSWDDLGGELAEIFDGYSFRADDYRMALEQRAAEQNHVSVVRAEWQKSKLYKADKREAHKRYRAKHKPWRSPERREYMRNYRAQKRAAGELRAAEAARAKRWRQSNKERWAAYAREWRAANRDRVNAYQRASRAANREAVNARQRERYQQMKGNR